ncbi:MAG: outer membrane lipoprotein-sorting protein [Candidatus Neomarinimicrobiota bacterium]
MGTFFHSIPETVFSDLFAGDRRRFHRHRANRRRYKSDCLLEEILRNPAEQRGTGLLMLTYSDPKKDDDRWLYLPALKKVRRIAGESKNEYFMGTDFTYDDMGGRGIDQDTHKLLGEETIDGVKCYKIESIPVDKNDMYSKKIGWVIPDKWVHLKVDFYDRKGQLIKTLKAEDIRNVSGVWMQFNLEMTNFSANHKTVLKIIEAKNDVLIDDQIFTTSVLERGGVK